MNDLLYVTIGAAVLFAAFVSLFAFQVYSGFHASLTGARVGDIFNFEYEQPYHGEPERILAKVIEPVYTLDDFQIRKLNARSGYRRNDPNFKRTKHLVTCEMSDGTVRNFYAERTRNVRKLPSNTLFRAVATMMF